MMVIIMLMAAEVPPLYKPSLVPEVAADASAKLAVEAGAVAKIFSEEATQRLADTNWFEATGDVVRGISEKARYADLVILGQYEEQGVAQTHPLPIAHSVVLRRGRPVLVVPAVTQPSTLGKIAVAWDGSREAVRAVHDALPIPRLARSAQMVKMLALFGRGRPDRSRKILAVHLTHHGSRCRDNVLQIRTAEELKSLQTQFADGHSDRLVMGGYSHAMWREFIFGGATQSILLSSKNTVLVSH